jgi:hypothetical protein
LKEIVYLNTDLINSFMAQKFGGLPINSTSEQSQQDSQGSIDMTKKASTHEVSGEAHSGSFKVPMFVASPSGKLSYKYNNFKQVEETISLTQIEAGKEIISKQLHDNALDDYEDFLIKNGSLSEVSSDSDGKLYLGKYIKITSPFSLLDLDYIRDLTEPTIMREIIGLSNDPLPKPANKQGRNQSVRLDPETEKGVHGMDVILRYLSKTLPTQLYLKQGGYLAPLKLEYLRENSRELNFKYGDSPDIKITLVGRATKQFESFEADIFEAAGNFVTISKAANVMTDLIINELKTIKKGDTIISPIAIYFE